MKYHHIIIATALSAISHVAICQTSPSNSNRIYELNVILQNDSSFKTMSKFLIDGNGKSHVSVKTQAGRNPIYPSDTKSIFVKIDATAWLKGIPSDSCWLFKSDEGKINSYSSIPEQGTNLIVAIQKGENGPIMALNKNNLLSMIADDPRALALAEENRLTHAIVQYNHPVDSN